MMHLVDFTLNNPHPQTDRPTPGHPITRTAGADDFCHSCGAQIAGDVTEFSVSYSEIHFVCEFCTLDPDAPIPFALTDLGEGVSDDL